jgi:hypothetical protein
LPVKLTDYLSAREYYVSIEKLVVELQLCSIKIGDNAWHTFYIKNSLPTTEEPMSFRTTLHITDRSTAATAAGMLSELEAFGFQHLAKKICY